MANSHSPADHSTVPATPPHARTRSADSMNKSSYASPPPMSASMTPPPSTQPPRFQSPVNRIGAAPIEALLASPPPTTIRSNVLGALPTPDAIAKADMEELRTMATELVSAVREARTSAAHFKLQHNLLTIEADQAAQRAEVEQQMSRREIEVLQTLEYRHRAAMHSRNSLPPPQPQIEALTKTCRALEDERDETEKRLARAKKLVGLQSDRIELLEEENALLRRRIRENREHFTRFKSLSPSYNTPRDTFTTPHRKPVPPFPEAPPNHSNIAALLAAGEVLNGESLSVPSTPTRTHTSKLKHGHTRGAHSLSSLQTTPVQVRPATRNGYPESMVPLSAPASQLVIESAERERHDRDSTISISDAEEGNNDDSIPESLASSLASDMLRRNPGGQESLRLSQGAERSSNLLQSKIFGPIKKPGQLRKRGASFGETDIKMKKAKISQGVGLGIGPWSQG
ncbi:uncharacterized protein Z519_08530 [Cladophialophora bantiana CBS 173.52]|uniref:Uncharacterized protein n=1 Tax=Cladophialophora bantiana (strain ATCC 10958 / CBS 173.52 / CDC B-1940 / NIH 8579) TaxID=1442370 RepID=A0A0D2FW33_CLAB1|nr:uncharacterized protein Z519_08530 [Cladophialophora bantiana CBS 173.52]KIW90747.1 hypothetical protein Z519_08530 [Cladophialophora bantiana CBS 173.52]